MSLSAYHHHLRRAEGPGAAPLVLALHGTGGDESQFAGLAAALAPQAHVLSPRGDVSEHGALRFFRRTGEGIYDMEDLALRTAQMAGWIEAWTAELGASRVLAFGYSNGANILASVAFQRPELFAGIALLHPLIPFEPAARPGLSGLPVLVTAGRRDPICPAPLSQRLSDWFSAQGAEVTLDWHDGGHELRQQEVDALARFAGRVLA
ncbi:alpha/beta hydrolase [Microvirga tunisiensis]|uniref:Alpha/beta hydrolase n=1 Tax=Pannonibacter tanglangensis TaxID=2750084 RepID=A0A7X5J9H6_9HYPH|nr:alpha/beta hydrolase [Pannonibacter sp. XCT-53]NBN78481.1 alpha/beta hydrolase [Pannonibacter sp. XCT-53]